jgi:hypothetical protein
MFASQKPTCTATGKARRARGFALVELAAVIALSTLLVAWKAPQLVRDVEDASMDSVGVYMQVLNRAVEKYNLSNHAALASGAPVAGFADPMAPTIAELRTARYLANPEFPTTITRQAIPVAVRIVPQNCPGADCQIFGVSYATAPMTFGTNNTRYDLVARFLQASAGAGAASSSSDPGIIRSAAFNVPNPNGAVGGTIAIGTYVDEGLYQRFVQIQDTRDPDLQGNLTVAKNVNVHQDLNVGGNAVVQGATTLNGPLTANDVLVNQSLTSNGPVQINNTLTTTGDARVGCVKLQAGDGRGGFNCLDPNDVPAGWGGGVRAWDVVAGGSVGSGERTPSGWQKMNYMSRDATEAFVHSDGRVEAPRVVPMGVYAPLSGCNLDGAIGKSSYGAGSLVVCSGATWLPLVTVAYQTWCPTNGSLGVNAAGDSVVCQNNQWMSTRDRMGKWSVQDEQMVRSEWGVGKPACGSGGQSMIYAVPQSISTNGTAYSTFSATDYGGYWIVHLLDQFGAPTDSWALVQAGCWYY